MAVILPRALHLDLDDTILAFETVST